jgi:hypothetical protein
MPLRLGNMGHRRHAHDDSDPSASARYYSHCNVQIPRCAKERRPQQFALPQSNADTDADTHADRRLTQRGSEQQKG